MAVVVKASALLIFSASLLLHCPGIALHFSLSGALCPQACDELAATVKVIRVSDLSKRNNLEVVDILIWPSKLDQGHFFPQHRAPKPAAWMSVVYLFFCHFNWARQEANPQEIFSSSLKLRKTTKEKDYPCENPNRFDISYYE